MIFDIFKNIFLILISIICIVALIKAEARNRPTKFEAGMVFLAMGYGIISMFSQGMSGLFDLLFFD